MAFDVARSLDDVDWGIVEILQEDGRISFTELGRRVAMSAPAVGERVRRLEESGVISGYRAEIDLERVGLPIVAVVRLRVSLLEKVEYERVVRELPQVLECLRITGEDCFVHKVAAASISELEAVIDVLARYGQTTTSVVVSQPLRHRIISRPEAAAGPETATA